MPAYLRIGEVAKAMGVSVDTLRRREAAGRIHFQRINNQRVLPADELESLLGPGATPPASSARNRLPGTVVAIERDGVMARVELACGEFQLVALMTRDAADELELEIGRPATAVIKAATVTVEAP